MVWQWLHRFLVWAPVALATLYATAFTGMAAAAGTNETAKWFVDRQIQFWRDAMTDGWTLWWVAALAIAVWLGAFLWTGLKAEHAGSRQDLMRDEALADRADELARDMLDEQAAMESARRQRQWGDTPDDDLQERWLANRKQEAVEEGVTGRRFSFRLQSVLSEFEHRGIRVDAGPPGIRWDTDSLGNWANGLILVASAVRAGNYTGKVLQMRLFQQAFGTPDELAERDAAKRRPLRPSLEGNERGRSS